MTELIGPSDVTTITADGVPTSPYRRRLGEMTVTTYGMATSTCR